MVAGAAHSTGQVRSGAVAKSASPENIVYADPKLAPGGAGGEPRVPENLPNVSAYTGLEGDVPPPPGMLVTAKWITPSST